MSEYYVYMMTNKSNTTLYTGVTNDLKRRVYQHKAGMIEGFTKKYRIKKLVHYEITNEIEKAIEREKQIKGWVRRKKNVLVETKNPEWRDLSEGWYE